MAPATTRHAALWDRRVKVGLPLTQQSLHPCRGLRLQYPEEGVSFEPYRDLEQHEGVFRVDRPCEVLLREGWVVEHALWLHERAQIAHETWRHRPGLRRYVVEHIVQRPQRHLERAISLRTRGDGNYYHAINDILGGRIRLIDACGLAPDIPVLVSANFACSSYFAEIRRTRALASRELIIQEKGRIACDQLYYAESATLNAVNIGYAVDALDVPDGDARRNDRVFIARRPPAQRAIENSREIEDLVRRYGFQVVDTNSLTLSRQIHIFNSASVVIGAHGAGLVNVVFRRGAPLHLVELFHPRQVQPGPPPAHYMVIAQSLGFGYTPVVSTECQQGNGQMMSVVANTLERVIKKVLAAHL